MPRDESPRQLPPHLDPRAGHSRPGGWQAAAPRAGSRRLAVTVRALAAVLSVLVLAAAVAAQVPGAAVTADDSLTPGAVQLVLGADFTGVGAAVSAPVADAPADTYASSERTADDTSCIA